MKTNAMKTIVSFVSALVLLGSSMTIPTFASSRSNVEGLDLDHSLEEGWFLGNSNVDYNDIVVYPGDELIIPLTSNMFRWGDGRNLVNNQAVQLNQIRRGVEVRTLVQAGWEALDYVQLDTDMVPGRPFTHPQNTSKTGRTTCISVVFANELVSVEDVDFEIDIYLKANDERDEAYTLTLRGTMKHEEVDITPETDYIDISDGTVAVADSFATYSALTDFNVGQGVTISKLVWKDYKYYGTLDYKDSTSIQTEDYPAIYSEIHGVYRLNTVNLEKGVNRVTIDPILNPDRPDVTEFYVYNNEMEYLGTTKDELPYSEKYILTYEQLDSFETGSYIDHLESQPTQEVAENPSNIAILPTDTE